MHTTIERPATTSATFGTAGHLSARVANLLQVLETIVEFGELRAQRDETVLTILRAVKEDADALSDLLN